MRAVVVSIWIFVNLVILGMCGYIYLLWSQYWLYLERQNQNVITTRNIYDQQIYYYNHGYPNETKAHHQHHINETVHVLRKKHSIRELRNNTVTLIKNSKPRFPNLQQKDMQLDTERFKCSKENSTQCGIKINNFKTELLYEFRRVLTDESNVFKSGLAQYNPYNVHFKGKRGNFADKTWNELMCDLKNVSIRTIIRSDSPFNKMEMGKLLPKKGLFEKRHFNTCAIIASAGSLKNSNLGARIDSHDLVLRFNHAPTEGFEKDVGRKTTIRIVNSQVITKPEYNFLNTELYKNINILAWDPSNYTSTLADWSKSPEFNLFPMFAEYRKKYPRSRFYLLDPRSLWNLWNFLQEQSPNRLRKNPPSSGFLGIAELLHHCNFVDVFEYVPSTRVTKRCHYYDNDNNPSCTFGAWHPLAAEKLLAYALNIASDFDVFQTGFIRIPGFSKINC